MGVAVGTIGVGVEVPGTAVSVGVGVRGVGVRVGVADGVSVGVAVGVHVGELVGVFVRVFVGVTVAVWIGVGVSPPVSFTLATNASVFPLAVRSGPTVSGNVISPEMVSPVTYALPEESTATPLPESAFTPPM